ncbi:OOP family OmpA-OmpF porin [Oxalobacteraceae bacterium GrIS 1.11]
MKQQFFTAMIGAVLTLPLIAQAEGMYIGADFGRSELKIDSDSDSGNFKKNGFQLNAGYTFDQHFGVEAGYVHLGDIDSKSDFGTSKLKTRALYVAATGTLPLNQQFSLFAKTGITFNRYESSATFDSNSDTFNQSNTAAMFGVGAAFNVNKNIALLAEYEYFGTMLKIDEGKLKASTLSLGLRYKF